MLAPSAKKSAKTKHPLPPETPPTCLEVRGEAIEVQEFLQKLGRDNSWRIGESRAAEDSLSYVRYFNAEELEKYANTAVTPDNGVKFESGRAAVNVRTTELGAGYVRVQILVHFLGEAAANPAAMGQPSTQWPLASNGMLEKELTTALQTKYRPLE
jgi:hypothetical protein